MSYIFNIKILFMICRIIKCMEGIGMNSAVSVMETMAQRYNQLYLTPKKGISETGVYTDIVHYGKTPPEVAVKMNEGLSGFKCSKYDKLFSETTPAGKVDIVYIHERSDFERFIQIMAYRGEPANVSSSLESAEIVGITNWRKIEQHMNEYIDHGGNELSWRDELRKFRGEKKNYQDTLIIISNCDYSGVNADEAGFGELVWNQLSLKIRIYNACALYTCRRIYKKCNSILLEEIFGDCVGMLFALNKYDTSLARKFMGVSGKKYNGVGRLKSLVLGMDDVDIDKVAVNVSTVIDKVGTCVKKMISSGVTDYYEILSGLEEKANTYISILEHK